MTTSRFEKVSRSDLKIESAGCAEPDAIGINAWLDDERELFSIQFHADGYRSITFFVENVEFDAMEFRELIDDAYAELEEWYAKLRMAGAAWDGEPLTRLKVNTRE